MPIELVCQKCGTPPRVQSGVHHGTVVTMFECKCGLYRRDGISREQAIQKWKKRPTT